jgi:ribosomal protein L12E/L44/L45/RPP1/RPP2
MEVVPFPYTMYGGHTIMVPVSLTLVSNASALALEAVRKLLEDDSLATMQKISSAYYSKLSQVMEDVSEAKQYKWFKATKFASLVADFPHLFFAASGTPMSNLVLFESILDGTAVNGKSGGFSKTYLKWASDPISAYGSIFAYMHDKIVQFDIKDQLEESASSTLSHVSSYRKVPSAKIEVSQPNLPDSGTRAVPGIETGKKTPMPLDTTGSTAPPASGPAQAEDTPDSPLSETGREMITAISSFTESSDRTKMGGAMEESSSAPGAAPQPPAPSKEALGNSSASSESPASATPESEKDEDEKKKKKKKKKGDGSPDPSSSDLPPTDGESEKDLE